MSRQAGGPERSPGADGMSPADRATLDRVRSVSDLADEAFRIPGTNIRFGLDPIIGILPVIGDTAVSLFSLYIILESYRADVSATVLVKMVIITSIDVVIGSIPVLGSVFDAVWKANTWNANMLEKHLKRRVRRPPRQPETASQGMPAPNPERRNPPAGPNR